MPSDHYGVVADLELNEVAIGGGDGLPALRDAHASLWPDASP
jgi:hypothetical protein